MLNHPLLSLLELLLVSIIVAVLEERIKKVLVVLNFLEFWFQLDQVFFVFEYL